MSILKKNTSLIFILVFLKEIPAQINLIPNNDFEYYTNCPANIGGNGDFNKAFPWNRIQGSPDYFNSCDSVSNNLGVPTNAPGNQYGLSGVGYGGFYTLNLGFANGGREYIAAPLQSGLTANNYYLVSFYVSLADNCEHATNTIGAFFSVNPVTGHASSPYLYLNYIPQIQNDPTNQLTDKINWILIQDTMVAQGGEQYMTIGNFLPDAQSAQTYVGGGTGWNSAYYYIDDVSVIDLGPTGIKEYKIETNVSIGPNPGTGLVNVSAHDGLDHAYITEVYDLQGKLIAKDELRLRNGNGSFTITAENGVYILHVTDAQTLRTERYKLIINK